MSKYDYRRAITDDIKDWIMNETDIPETGLQKNRDDDFYNWVEEEIWDSDSVVGNGGDYYGTEEFCSECLAGNFDLLYSAVHEYNIDNEIMSIIEHYESKDLARYFDCVIRCHLLIECIYRAVDELIAEGEITWHSMEDEE